MGVWRGRVKGRGADCWGMGELNLLLSSDAVHKQRNRGTSEVLALNQVGENWQ